MLPSLTWVTQTDPMTPDDVPRAQSRRFIRLFAWTTLVVGALMLVVGIWEAVTGTGLGYLFVVLGVIFVALGILYLRVLAMRPSSGPSKPLR